MALLKLWPKRINMKPQVKAIAPAQEITPDQGYQPLLSTLSPQQIYQCYSMTVTSTTGTGKTIAIISAYAAPTVVSDMASYCSYYGLPSCNLTVVNQTGGSTLPTTVNATWQAQTALDTQVIHAMAPGANIICVLCNTDTPTDLFAGVSWAASNAEYVNMGWGYSESSYTSANIQAYNQIFANASTVTFVAGAGDTANSVLFPASSPNVVSVGGTTIAVANQLFDAEFGWVNGGGGCSTVFTSPSSQSAYGYNLCSGMRCIPDVAMVANQGTTVYVAGTFMTVLGTSLSTAIFSGRSVAQGTLVNLSYVYATPSVINYRDIVEGAAGTNECLPGPDLVTGIGSWNGNVA